MMEKNLSRHSTHLGIEVALSLREELNHDSLLLIRDPGVVENIVLGWTTKFVTVIKEQKSLGIWAV